MNRCTVKQPLVLPLSAAVPLVHLIPKCDSGSCLQLLVFMALPLLFQDTVHQFNVLLWPVTGSSLIKVLCLLHWMLRNYSGESYHGYKGFATVAA